MTAKAANYIALFKDINPATTALDVLRGYDIRDQDLDVLSGEPHNAEILGRPLNKTNVAWIGISGFLIGFAIAFALVWGTPQLYPIQAGARPLFSIPPWLVLTFEFSMLGLLIGTFLGVIWESDFPAYGPKLYHQKISDGYTGIIFTCPADDYPQIKSEIERLGGELVANVEEKRV